MLKFRCYFKLNVNSSKFNVNLNVIQYIHLPGDLSYFHKIC